ETTSGFRVEAAASCGYRMAGRRLANSSRPPRRPSRPFSGRSSRSGSVSHFGPPTAPSRMASAARACSMVTSGSGLPCTSYAAPPSRPSSMARPRPNLAFTTSRTLTASATISGPIPSPGRTSTFLDILFSQSDARRLTLINLIHSTTSNVPGALLRQPASGPKQPGSSLPPFVFISFNQVRILQRQADIIEAIQQAVLTERINLKGVFFAIRAANHLRFQVHGQLIAFVGFHRFEQLINALLIQHDRQQAVLEAVIEENVGVAGRDNGT